MLPDSPDAGTVLRSVFWHSIALALLMGLLVLAQTYWMPWIVPGYPDGNTAVGVPFPIPSLKDVAGQDMSRFAQVDFDPQMRAWSQMRRILPGNPSRCQPARDFPLLMQFIRQVEAGGQ